MNNRIILKDGKTLIGVSGVSISELDNSIFITNSCQIEEGAEGSLAFYCRNGVSSLYSTGDALHWDHRSSILTTANLTTTNLKTTTLTTPYLTSGKLTTTDINVGDRVSFSNFVIKERSNAGLNSFLRNSFRESLLVEYVVSNKKHIVLVSIDKERTYLNCSVNIKSKTVKSSMGEETDLKGDIALDENFICYCIQDYDGKSKIWKRSELTSW